ncbi:PAS domain-containing protein, partial [Pseudanabaenaceae cyanobacterium LEGE 13415]|nr:PAS domain-containing protein [Pseudanabaenaceae cyanobacterium LEGE 13415]
MTDSDQTARLVTTKTAFRTSEIGIVLQLADSTIAACNSVAQDLLGMTIEQLQDASSTNRPWQTIHPDGTDFPGETHPAMVALQTGQPCCDVVMGFYQPNGNLVWLNINAYPLFHREGSAPYAITVSFTQVTEESLDRQTPNASLYLDLIQEATQSGIWDWDFETNTAYISRQYCVIMGFDLDRRAATYEEWLACIHPDDRTAASEQVSKAIQQGKDYASQYRVLHPNGTRWIDSRGKVYFDRDHQPIRMLGNVQDITAYKEAELALRQSEAFKDRLLESSPDCIKVLDLEGRLLYMNAGGLCRMEIDDFTPFCNTEWISFWQGADRQQAEQAFAIALQGQVSSFSGYCPTAKGTPKWWEVIVSPIVDATGQVEQVLSISRDVTDRKQIEAERQRAQIRLKDRQERLEAALFAAGTGTFRWDIRTNELDWDENLDRLFGLPPGQTARSLEAFIALVHPDDRQSVIDGCTRCANEGADFDLDFRVIYPDGSIHWLSDKGKPFFDASGKPVYMMGACVDITDRESLLQQEQAAREASERANQVKDEFLAVLSHELRSPLNPILGWSKILKSRRLDPTKMQEAISIIERNAQLQAQLIEDLLDISRILRGKLTLNSKPVDLVNVISSAQETVRLAAEAKKIAIVTEFESRGMQVLGDAGRLQQVIWNLLSNAVKFTPEGGHITVRLVQVASQAQIQVIDTGKGIELDFLPYVFERFRQADSSTTRQFGGLGLGLAIVRQLVELHGGTVQVESAGEGQGATFIVHLPLISEPRNQQVQSPDLLSDRDANCLLNGYRILVVDAEMDSREFVAFVLEQEGAIVTQVASASEALLVLSRLRFDAMVSDIGMPEMNGYSLIQQVRTRSLEQGGQIPALALTAYASELDAKQALQAGFRQHLAKPIDPSELTLQ